MRLARDWLWDRKISIRKARAILANPEHQLFLSLCATLLSRKNTPREVFRYYLKPKDFIRHWRKIKNKMRKDRWNDPRITFWQAVYETVKKKYEQGGFKFEKEAAARNAPDDFCQVVADKIRSLRKQKALTQRDLAKRLKVSQQLVSRIEQGRENISLLTLKNIAAALQADLRVEIS